MNLRGIKKPKIIKLDTGEHYFVAPVGPDLGRPIGFATKTPTYPETWGEKMKGKAKKKGYTV